jgi:hypothetical protein
MKPLSPCRCRCNLSLSGRRPHNPSSSASACKSQPTSLLSGLLKKIDRLPVRATRKTITTNAESRKSTEAAVTTSDTPTSASMITDGEIRTTIATTMSTSTRRKTRGAEVRPELNVTLLQVLLLELLLDRSSDIIVRERVKPLEAISGMPLATGR